MKFTFPCSPEQADVIEEHLLYQARLGMQPDERAWILAAVNKVYPGAKVLSANLNLENAEWTVELNHI